VRTIKGPIKAGFHRVAWDLTYPTTNAIERVATARWGGSPDRGDSGFMAPPGTYSVTLSKRVDGQVTDLAGPADFEVKRVFKGVLEGSSPTDTALFMGEVAELQRAVTAADEVIELTFERIDDLEKALARSKTEPGGLDSELEALKQRLYELDEALSGNRSRSSMGEPGVPTVAGRLRVASMTDGRSDYGPTATHRRAFEIATQEFLEVDAGLRTLIDVDLPALEAMMEAAGVPWTPGRPLPEVR
jgi:hypothetical protein